MSARSLTTLVSGTMLPMASLSLTTCTLSLIKFEGSRIFSRDHKLETVARQLATWICTASLNGDVVPPSSLVGFGGWESYGRDEIVDPAPGYGATLYSGRMILLVAKYIKNLTLILSLPRLKSVGEPGTLWFMRRLLVAHRRSPDYNTCNSAETGLD